MPEFIARHNISSGPKGERRTIVAGQRFNPKDFPGISDKEWEAMYKAGTFYSPQDPSYASPSEMQKRQQEAAGSASEGRSPRTDLVSQQQAAAARTVSDDDDDGDGDDDDDRQPPTPASRGGRRRAPKEDDDEV